MAHSRWKLFRKDKWDSMPVIYFTSHWGHASPSWRRWTWSTHGRSPLWRPFTDDLTTMDTENKIMYIKETERSLSPKPGSIQILPISIIPLQAHTPLGTQRVKTLLLKPQGYYKEIQQTRNTTQPDTVVTIYADRAVWGIFLSRPPRQSGV